MSRWVVWPAILLLALPALAQTTPQERRHRLSSPIAYFDDADVLSPGMISLTHDFSYGSVLAGNDWAYPGAYLAIGLHPRVDFSGGFSYVRSRFEDIEIQGAGDAYFGTKVVLVPEGERIAGVAVKPMIEVLGTASITDNPLAPDRVNALFPVMVQKSFESFRVYGTTGYFTRGIVFASLAYEWDGWSRVIPTVVVSHARLTQEHELVAELQLNRSRSDFLVGAGVPLSPRWSAYGNLSRSFGRKDPNSLRYQISGGVSFTFRLW